MPNINTVVIGGHLGRDPERESDAHPAKFSVAVTETWKDGNDEKQERTNWIQVVAWNGNADVAMQRLKSGDPVVIEGSFRSSEWEDAETKKKRSKVEVVASRIHLIPRRSTNGNGEEPKKSRRTRE